MGLRAMTKLVNLPKSTPGNTRAPIAYLLHALNQPLTALQCSMEVALASRRTLSQYAQGLREGLKLTERMRILVEAIREIDEVEQEQENEHAELIEVQTVLSEILNELEPAATAKGVRIAIELGKPSFFAVRMTRRRLVIVVFRLLESTLSLADRSSELKIQADGTQSQMWIRVMWHSERPHSAFSQPELGLVVAKSGWERMGAEWQRERTDGLERLTIRLDGSTGGQN